jgi:hypothetical protein
VIGALAEATRSTTKTWTIVKRQRARVDRVDLDRLRHGKTPKLTIKAACYEVMAEAYREASGNGRYPANARQWSWPALVDR